MNIDWKNILLVILALVFIPLWPLTIAAFISYKIYRSDIQKRWVIISAVVLLTLFAFPSWMENFKTSENKNIITETTPKIDNTEQLESKINQDKPLEIIPVENNNIEDSKTSEPALESAINNKSVEENTSDIVETTVPASAVIQEKPQATTQQPDEGYSCNCKKTCSQMTSCREAQYQLNTCGCSARDADDDGIACDADCQ